MQLGIDAIYEFNSSSSVKCEVNCALQFRKRKSREKT